MGKDKRKREENEDKIKEEEEEEEEQVEESSEKDDDDDEAGSEGELDVYTAYVEGFPYETSEEELWTLFSSQGELVDMRLPRWNDSGRLRGYGHFDYSSEQALSKCISNLNRHQLGKRYLSVSRAKSKQQSSSATPQDVPEGCTTLFVKNLPYDTDDDAVVEAFSAFGKVVSVRLARWNHTGRLKGFGYVQFAKDQGVRAAVSSKTPIMVADRRVVVDPETTKSKPKKSFRDTSGRSWYKTEGRRISQADTSKKASKASKGKGSQTNKPGKARRLGASRKKARTAES